MSWLHYGGGLALAGAFYIGGAADCFSETETKPAAGGQPRQSEESQSQGAESVQEQPEGEVVEIPLDTIWALGMPGTRNVRELPTARADERIVESIRKTLRAPKPTLTPGFAVSGPEDEVLAKATKILAGKIDASRQLAAGDDISVIFFSRQFGQYVHLEKVERRGNIIEVRYQFLPHEEAEMTQHFALIRLGELPAGEYRVNIVQAPMPQSLLSMGFRPPPKATAEMIVCQSFDFTVLD